MTDWTALNRSNWDERATPHAESPDYAIDRFIADPAFLSGVVRARDLAPRRPVITGTTRDWIDQLGYGPRPRAAK